MKHLIFNEKKVFALFIWLIFGLSLIFYGMTSYMVQMKQFNSQMTDQEIIERAKGLGMVEIKEKLKESK